MVPWFPWFLEFVLGYLEMVPGYPDVVPGYLGGVLWYLGSRHFVRKNIDRSHWSSWTGRHCELHAKISSRYNEFRSCLNSIF